MRTVLLVAWREFRQVIRTRGFWVSLMVLPVALSVTYFAQRVGGPPEGAAYMIVDASGRYGEAVRRRMEINHQREVLTELSRYEARWAGAKRRPWVSEPQIVAFMDAGGAQARLTTIRPRLAPDAPDFEPPARRLSEAVAPPALRAADPAVLASRVAPLLGSTASTSEGPRPLTTVVAIPADFPASAAQIWTNGETSNTAIEVARSELARQLRLGALIDAGLTPAQIHGHETIQAPIEIATAGENQAAKFARGSVLPLMAAYLLLMSMLMSGSLLLQGVMEERSNKLLEAVLACVTPDKLMYGKLLGLGAIGLIMISVWAGCAFVAGATVEGQFGELIRAAVISSASPTMIGAVLFYFFAGQIMYSTLFLAVGSMSDSMQDAQGYLTPIMLTVLLPFMLLMGQVVRDPHGPLPTILPWIPIYTPFAMLARMGGGVSMVEAIGTSVLMVVFLVLELILLGRVFRHSLLRTGQPPKLRDLVRLMGRKAAA